MCARDPARRVERRGCGCTRLLVLLDASELHSTWRAASHPSKK